MVTETSGTRTGTLDSEYENIGIIPIYFVLHWLLGLAVGCIIYEEGERRHAEGVCRTKIRGKKRKKKKKGKRRRELSKYYMNSIGIILLKNFGKEIIANFY